MGCLDVVDLTFLITKEVQDTLLKGLQPKGYNRILKIELDKNSKENVLEKISVLILREDIKYAGPNYIISRSSLDMPQINIGTNDTYANLQWGLINANVSTCWRFTTGSPEVLVGVVDSGIACDVNDTTGQNIKHPDLMNVVDGELSRDFTVDSNEPPIGGLTDIVGHGTHIAGIISAMGNNNQGVAGVCWNVKLVSLKIFNNSIGYDNSVTDRLIKAIVYARSKGIQVLNLSLATTTDLNQQDPTLESVLSEYPGIVVCAAGNWNVNINETPVYPASYNLNNLISVGAINSSNELWVSSNQFAGGVIESSNYGVDIFAPGAEIYSTWNDGTYAYDSGTSMATPFVVGVVAMLKSINPNLTNAQIKSAILNGADTFNYSVLVDGTNVNYTSKQLNALGALKYAMNLHTDSKVLQYSVNPYEINVNSSSTYYNQQRAMVKLVVNEEFNYGFSVESTNALTVKLFNNNLSEIEIDQVITNGGNKIEFTKTLTNGIYYIEAQFISPNINANITIDFTIPPHTHGYTDRYVWYNNYKHKSYCVCNEYNLSPHVSLQPDPDVCVLCLGVVGGNIPGGGLIMNSVKTQVSQNGSYITINGIIVLNELDVESYFNGTLTFMPYGSQII